MGQTLTHGVYLPDEGERNCYSGLAANWQILDSSVGTIAAHTAALSGKAPLVHTHTKSGVTDLLNSNFIPSANNSYDLGSSSYQWNNLYAKNYYYNGTAWGLDKANVWTGTNTFQQNITYERTNFFHQAVNPSYILKDTGLEKGSLVPTAHTAYPGMWQDKNGNVLGYVRFVEYDSGRQTAEFRVSNLIKNGTVDPTGSTVNCTVNLELQPSGEKSLIPEQNNDINLGTSTNKWKTLNGINPGALSLPDLSRKSSILEYITDLTGGLQYYTPLADGWICIQTDNSSASNYIRCAYGDILAKSNGNGQAQGLSVLIPVLAGVQVGIRVVCTALSSAYFYHSQGNVS